MKYFTLMVEGLSTEVIPETIDVQFPGEETPRAVPLSARYTSEFIASLVPYDPANPPAPPAPSPVTGAQVLAERTSRMAQATAEIAPLQDLVDLGESTDEDELKLIDWKQYRAAVSKVQTQPGFPISVIWPATPEI